MYRKSSRGNPYHDARGRFTSASGTGKNQAVIYSVNNEQQDISHLSNKADREEFDDKYITKNPKKTEKHYFNQSVDRENKAKDISVSYGSVLDGSIADQKTRLFKARDKFMKENKYALEKGAEVNINIDENGNFSFQLIESSRTVDRVEKGKSVTVNTSTSMKAFHGFSVESYTGNEYVRSCRKGATKEEETKSISEFCKKYVDITSDKDTYLKLWRDNEGRLKFMPVKHFDNYKDAQKFAKTQKKVTIVNNKTGKSTFWEKKENVKTNNAYRK